MSQVRFKIGIPGVGSAARTAEREASVARLNLPSGGSAARMAEERKRAETADTPEASTVANVSLRGQSGNISRRTASEGDMSSRSSAYHAAVHNVVRADEESSCEAEAALSEAHRTSRTLPSSVPSTPPKTSADGTFSVDPSPGVLQTAAVRFQSLLRSLFSSGDAAGKS